MIVEIFNRDSEMCVGNLQEFLAIWRDIYTEEHPLHEQFKKKIIIILIKSQGRIENEEYAQWLNEVYGDTIPLSSFHQQSPKGDISQRSNVKPESVYEEKSYLELQDEEDEN